MPKCGLPGESNLRVRFRAGLFRDPFGEICGAVADKSIVQESERLRRDGGVFAAAATCLRIGTVERLHEWMLHHAFVEQINAATPRGRTVLEVLWIRVLHVTRLNR